MRRVEREVGYVGERGGRGRTLQEGIQILQWNASQTALSRCIYRETSGSIVAPWPLITGSEGMSQRVKDTVATSTVCCRGRQSRREEGKREGEGGEGGKGRRGGRRGVVRIQMM